MSIYIDSLSGFLYSIIGVYIAQAVCAGMGDYEAAVDSAFLDSGWNRIFAH